VYRLFLLDVGLVDDRSEIAYFTLPRLAHLCSRLVHQKSRRLLSCIEREFQEDREIS
jgi:hypothetical protein